MAKTPVAVCFADSHLTDRVWASRPIYGDSYHSLTYIVDQAIELGVPLVGAGDLIDHLENRSGPIVFLNRQLDRLYAASSYIAYLEGQHELSTPPWLSGHIASWHAHTQPFDLGGIRCYGINYSPAGIIQQELDKIPADTDLLFMHQVLAEFMGSVAAPQCGIGDIPAVRAVFSGDYHVNREVDVRGKDGQPVHLVSPGSTCMCDISEAPEKFFMILYDDLTFERRQIPTRAFLASKTMNSDAELEQFLVDVPSLIAEAGEISQGLPVALQTPLLRVIYSYRLTDAVRRIRMAVGTSAHIFFKELPPEVRVDPAMVAADGPRDGAVTLDSALEGYLTAKEMPQLVVPSRRLLAATDVKSELLRMRAEALQ